MTIVGETELSTVLITDFIATDNNMNNLSDGQAVSQPDKQTRPVQEWLEKNVVAGTSNSKEPPEYNQTVSEEVLQANTQSLTNNETGLVLIRMSFSQ